MSATPASANATGCSGAICITVYGSGTHVTKVDVKARYQWTGHVWIHSTDGMYGVNSTNRTWYTTATWTFPLGWDFDPGVKLCVTAYDMSLANIGRPCVTIG